MVAAPMTRRISCAAQDFEPDSFIEMQRFRIDILKERGGTGQESGGREAVYLGTGRWARR